MVKGSLGGILSGLDDKGVCFVCNDESFRGADEVVSLLTIAVDLLSSDALLLRTDGVLHVVGLSLFVVGDGCLPDSEISLDAKGGLLETGVALFT